MQQLVGHLSAQDRDAKIVSMYKAGALRREISEQVGCGHSTISLVLKRHGVENRGSRKGCLSPDLGEAVRKLYLSGLSVTEVGKKLGMTRNAVSGVIFRNRISRDGTGAPVARERCAPQKAERRAAKAEKAKPQLVVVPAEAITVFQPKRSEPDRCSRPKLLTERLSGECAWPVSGEGAGAPVRAVRITPRKLYYIERFLEARWHLDAVAMLFDVSPDAIVEAMKCAS